MKVYEIKKEKLGEKDVYSLTFDKGMLYAIRDLMRDYINVKSRKNLTKQLITKIGMMSRSWNMLNDFIEGEFGEDKTLGRYSWGATGREMSAENASDMDTVRDEPAE